MAVASRLEQLARGGASMRLRDLGRTLTILLSATCFWQRGGFSNNKPPQDFLFSWVVKKSQLSGLGEENRPGRQMSSDLEFSLSLPVKQLVRSYTGAATPQSPPLTPKTDTAESPPLVLHAHSAVRACRGDPDVPPLLRRYSSSGFSLLHGSRTKPCTGSSIDDIAPGQ